jgi:hypothetical protein
MTKAVMTRPWHVHAFITVLPLHGIYIKHDDGYTYCRTNY